MAYWHEVSQNTGGWLILPEPGRRVAASFRGRDVRKAPFQGHFIRYEGAGKVPSGIFPSWHRKPEGWFELWPHEPIFASSMEEAKSLIQPLLPLIEAGSIDARFERKPYKPRLWAPSDH